MTMPWSKQTLYMCAHQFNSDSNACSTSFYGIAYSARVVAVFMVEMSLKKHPFIFNSSNREKS